MTKKYIQCALSVCAALFGFSLTSGAWAIDVDKVAENCANCHGKAGASTERYAYHRWVALRLWQRVGFLLLVFVVPFALLGVAFILQYLGLLAERWFFFAQANHPQNLYYQHVS